MRKFKKVLAVVMAAAVTVTACPSVTAEGVVSVSDVLKSSGVISQVNAGERSSEGDYKYQVSFDSIEIIRYIGKGGDVVIPSEIEGKKVTDIGDSAFAENKSITSVKIPNTVHSISQMAFSGCSSLTSVNIPNSVREIGSNAFYGCTSLTSVNIPESVSEMYGYHVFEGCSSLKSINVDDNNSNFSSLNGVLFNKDKTFLIQYPAKKEDKSYSIPNSVTNIEDIAFNGCTSLTSVKVPEGLTRIGGFSGCTALTSVNIPNSVTTIEGNA
ncbi:MAG: leucine-rich repeat domain-containing protein, partial [Ruminiclostridium sp.]|nr:leucine-rich repeat domain-containing protein [Ruminiclostridium sp.]